MKHFSTMWGLVALLLLPVPSGAQEFGAVLVRGDGGRDRLIVSETAGMCLWVSTYNLNVPRGEYDVAVMETRPVTLSFYTLPLSEELLAQATDSFATPSPGGARFHTRLYRTPPGGPPPPTESRKEYGDGPFDTHHALTDLGELVLAEFDISTRRGQLGLPSKREYTAEERASILEGRRGFEHMVVRDCLSDAPRPPENYSRIEPVPLPDALEEDHLDGRFNIDIDRQYRGDRERELLEMAESLLPDPEVIAAAADSALEGHDDPAGNWRRMYENAASIPGDRWWWIRYDGVLLPFALTGPTVVHYMERVRELAAIPNPFIREGEYTPPHRAWLEYDAVVVPTRDGGHIVELTMEWSFWCGRLCALGFTHTRTVEFDAEGDVVSIMGDRPTRYIVS